MATIYENITPKLKDFIENQHIFFVATAPLSGQGHINLSPKGMDCFRVLSPNLVGYMDLVGSGTETSAHVYENGRITFMFCAFDGAPSILRLYGKGRLVLPGSPEWAEIADQFPIVAATRQIILADIDRVQTSCGFVVPTYEYKAERDIHPRWAEEVGPDGIAAFNRGHSAQSIDGIETALAKAQGWEK